MDKQALQERIAQINAEMIQTKANYAKLEGHLQEVNHWLMNLITKEAQAGLEAQGDANGQANNIPEEQIASEQVCAAEGEEVPSAGCEPRSECEGESPATV